MINADGTGLRRLTFDGLECAAHWSPGGSRLAFARGLQNGKGVIATMRADGTGKKTNLTDDVWGKFWPVYTPDGRQIVFFSGTGGLISAVRVMHSDGSDKRRLTAPALEGFAYDVSPDGLWHDRSFDLALLFRQKQPPTARRGMAANPKKPSFQRTEIIKEKFLH